MSLQNTLLKGRKKMREDHALEEVGKKGTLRGGSAGIFTRDGKVYGTCPRLAHLRKLGYQADPEPTADILFAAGYGNEDIMAKEMTEAGIHFKREEEIPVEWFTDNGTKVSGRPDFVVTREDETPVYGIEAKLISSIWTASSIIGKGEPKSNHLIQAAHYSMHMGIPWKLVYANRAYWHINYNKILTDVFMGNPLCEHKKGRPFRVLTDYVIFDLEWDGDMLVYSLEGTARWTPTAITKQSIVDYYNAVAEVEATNSVPPRPVAKHVNGSDGYKECDYCPLAATCDEHDGKGLAAWTDHAKLSLNTINKERAL